MLAGLATWVIVGHSRAAARRRRDRRADRPQARPGASTPGCGRSCASASSSRSARRAERPRPSSTASSRGALAAIDPARAGGGRPRHRLRAGLGDRDRAATRSGADAAAMAEAIRAALGAARLGPRPPTTSRSSTAAASPSANIGEFLAEPSIDGALVGGASLKPDEMAGIVARAGADGRGPRPRARDRGVTGRPPSRSTRATAADRPRRPRRVRDRARSRPPTRSPPRGCRSGAASSRAGRTRASARPRRPSACRRARWATPRSATSTSAPGRPVLQDLPRIDAAIADGSFFDAAGAARRLRARRAARRPAPRRQPDRARAASTPTTATSSPSPSWPRGSGVAGGPRPRPARRPRHAAAVGARVRRATSRRRLADGPPGRPDRDGRRPLLRDGSRPALGADRARLRRDRPRGGGARAVARPPRSRRPTRAARTTSSSRRRSSTASTAGSATATPIVHANFRADRARQLTHALADARLRRRSTATSRRPPGPARPARRDDDRVRGRPAGRGRLPARGGPLARPRRVARPAGASSTSPRPRSTPT